MQTTLTRIFIALESELHGLSENWDGISRKLGNSNVFSAQKQVDSKKKRSSPKLRLIFRPKSEILTLFQAESRHVLHNFGTQFPLGGGGGCFQIFTKKIGLKSTKNVRFCILHKPMGGARAPPPTLLGFWYVKTLNILQQKTTMPLTLLNVDQQSIHALPKYGIQMQCKTGENCSS